MSPKRPKTRSVLAIVRENAVAGQTLDERGMCRSWIKVGRMTLKPDTKYSVKIWLIRIEKAKAISAHNVVNVGGRSLPSLCIRASRLSSTSGSCVRSFSPASTGVEEEELSFKALIEELVGTLAMKSRPETASWSVFSAF